MCDNKVDHFSASSTSVSDNAYVHIAPEWAADLIRSDGLNPAISGYVTKWKYVKDVSNPIKFME